MPEHVHTHIRTEDKPPVIYIPSWVKVLTIAVVSIIAGTIATLTWLDNRYATKTDLATMGASTNEKLDDIKSDVADIKQYILRGR